MVEDLLQQIRRCKEVGDWVSECKLLAKFKKQGHTIEEISQKIGTGRTVVGDRIAIGNFPNDLLEIFLRDGWRLNNVVELLPLRIFEGRHVDYSEVRAAVFSFKGQSPTHSEIQELVLNKRTSRSKREVDRLIQMIVSRYGEEVLGEIEPVKRLILAKQRRLEEEIDQLRRNFVEKKRASLLQQINSLTKRKSDLIAMLLLVSSQLEYMDASEVESFLFEIDHLLKIVSEVRASVEAYANPSVIVGLLEK